MKQVQRGISSVGLVLLLAYAVGARAESGGREALEAWLERQASIETWTAEVTQTRKLRSLARPLESHGRVWFRQPNRFRWQLGDPPRTIAVRTADELVILYPRLRRMERYRFGDDLDPSWRQALALLDVGFPSAPQTFYETYEVVSTARAGDAWRFELRPAAAEARRLIESIRLEVAADDSSLLATELSFPDGSTLRNEFSGHQIDPDLDPSLFEVGEEEGYEVVDPLQGKN